MCGLLAFLIDLGPACTGLNNQRPDLPVNLPEQGDCSNYSNAKQGSQTRSRHIRQEFIRSCPAALFRPAPAPAAAGPSIASTLIKPLWLVRSSRRTQNLRLFWPSPPLPSPTSARSAILRVFCPSVERATLVPSPYGSSFHALAFHLRLHRRLRERVHLLRPRPHRQCRKR